jgi:hypothetical protein
MTTVGLMSRYILWHYTQGIADLVSLSGTLLWYIARTFSLSTLLRTFFQPWRQEQEAYPSIVHPGAFLESLGVNILMRIVGIIARGVLIILCIAVLIMAIPSIIITLILWLLLPLLIIALALIGCALLFS